MTLQYVLRKDPSYLHIPTNMSVKLCREETIARKSQDITPALLVKSKLIGRCG